MASGSVSTWAESYSAQTDERVQITVNFSITQNASANTSTISITSITCYYNYDYYAGKSFYIDGIITVDDKQIFYSNYKTPQATVSAGSWETHTISGGTRNSATITHGSDGKKTVTFKFAAVNTSNVSGFAGINGNYTNYQFFVRDSSDCSKTYTLPAIEQNVTISYNANGGTGTTASQTVKKNVATTLQANGFTAPTSKVWTLTLNGNGGNNGSPTFKKNYFNKWRAGSTTGTAYAAGASYTPTGNVTMYAWWGTQYVWGSTTRSSTSANGYTVTFEPKGGQCSTTSLTAKDVTSYTFLGWGSSADATTASWNATSAVNQTSNYTAYAVWSPSTTKGSITMPSVTRASTSDKTITLNYDGATGGNSTTSLSYTQTTAYTFKGWSADSSATSGSAAGASFTPTASGTVYAIWGDTTNTYSSVTLPTPTKTNYKFKGWSTSAGGTVVSTGGSYTPTSAITALYAIWEKTVYSLTVYPQSGTWEGSTSSQAMSVTVGNTKSISVPTRTGYQFGGWMTGAYGSLNNSSFKQSAVLSTSHNLTVYDNNNSGTITITWVDNSSGDSPTLYGKDYVTITKTAGTAKPDLGGFKRTVTPVAGATYYHVMYAKIPKGYTIQKKSNTIDGTFTWLTDQAGTNSWKVYAYKLVVDSSATNLGSFGYITIKADSGSTTDAVTWYVGANQITKSPTTAQTFTVEKGNSYLYASWIPNKYTVKYNANGGTGTTSNSTHYYGYSKKLTTNGFTKFGYTFKGWATSLDRANAGTVDYADQASVSSLTTTNGGTVNLYAVWEVYTKVYIYTDKKDGTKKWVPVEKYTYTGG